MGFILYDNRSGLKLHDLEPAEIVNAPDATGVVRLWCNRNVWYIAATGAGETIRTTLWRLLRDPRVGDRRFSWHACEPPLAAERAAAALAAFERDYHYAPAGNLALASPLTLTPHR